MMGFWRILFTLCYLSPCNWPVICFYLSAGVEAMCPLESSISKKITSASSSPPALKCARAHGKKKTPWITWRGTWNIIWLGGAGASCESDQAVLKFLTLPLLSWDWTVILLASGASDTGEPKQLVVEKVIEPANPSFSLAFSTGQAEAEALKDLTGCGSGPSVKKWTCLYLVGFPQINLVQKSENNKRISGDRKSVV